MTMLMSFARVCRDTRHRLDITQQQLGDAVGLSRGYIARIECSTANPTLEQVERIGEALGLRLSMLADVPIFLTDRRDHDLVHAHCSSYVDRRLSSAAWLIAREVEVSDGRVHAWIDLLAFDPATGTLLIIEVKTRLDDFGALERQLGWYEHRAVQAASDLGWTARTVGTWLVTLASDEVDQALRARRAVVDRDFPGRADQMLAVARRTAAPLARSVAMVDPRSRRTDWLLRTRLDGRRTAAPFEGYAHAAAQIHLARG